MPQFNAFGKAILIFVGVVLLWGVVIEPLIKNAEQATRQGKIEAEKAELQARQDAETPVQKAIDSLAYSDTPIADEEQAAEDDPGLNKILYLELSGDDVAERLGLVPEKSVKNSIPSLQQQIRGDYFRAKEECINYYGHPSNVPNTAPSESACKLLLVTTSDNYETARIRFSANLCFAVNDISYDECVDEVKAEEPLLGTSPYDFIEMILGDTFFGHITPSSSPQISQEKRILIDYYVLYNVCFLPYMMHTNKTCVENLHTNAGKYLKRQLAAGAHSDFKKSSKNIISQSANANSSPSYVDGKKKWIPYSEDGASASYFDVSSVKTVGQTRRYRIVLNFRQRLTAVMSVISHHEMNCETQKLRWTENASYTQPFGLGQIVSTTTPRDLGMDPETFSPLSNDVLKAEYNVVCK